MNKKASSYSILEYFLFATFLFLCVYAFFDKLSEIGKKSPQLISQIDKNDFSKLKKEVNILYQSLLEFKDENDFHENGFNINYKYNQWLKKIEDVESESRQKQLFFEDFSVGDLKMLGLEYIKTKGTENKYTNWVRNRLDKGLKK